ncbi:MAG TPA: hypothetical protein VN442_02415 [Bryobacteraceae bacterium]|nr:hypothetical protein [Bryobacteraceae bacterium]
MFVGVCRHDYLVPPGVPAVWWFIDFDVVNGITGLFAWPTAKYGYPPAKRPDHGEILDMGLPMEGRGTDATLIVPHVPVPLVPSVLLPLIILLGSSKIIMGSNRTRIWCQGLTGLTGASEEAVGCCIFPYIPVSLNLQCWDFACKKYDVSIGAPMMSDIVIAPNTVQVGIGFSDYLLAMIDWAIDIILAVVLAFGTKGAGKLWKKHKEGSALKAAAKGKKAYKAAKIIGMSDEAAERVEKKAITDSLSSWHDPISKPLTKAYDRLPEAGKKYLTGIALKLSWRLVSKSSWFRENVRHPIQESVL